MHEGKEQKNYWKLGSILFQVSRFICAGFLQDKEPWKTRIHLRVFSHGTWRVPSFFWAAASPEGPGRN